MMYGKKKSNRSLLAIGSVAVVALMLFSSAALLLTHNFGYTAGDGPGYTVTYDPNYSEDESGIPTDTCTYANGDTVPVLFDVTPYRVDHAFLGWSTDPGETTPDFPVTVDRDANHESLREYTMGSSDVTFYAVWKKAGYDASLETEPVSLAKSITSGNISITYSASKYYVNSVEHTNNVVKISGTTTANTITVESTAPKGSGNELHLIISGLTVDLNDGNSDTIIKNPMKITPGSYAILQAQDTNKLATKNPNSANIHLIKEASSVAELLFMGQTKVNGGTEVGNLLLSKGTSSDLMDAEYKGGAGIGGNSYGRTAESKIPDSAGIFSMDSGDLDIKLLGTHVPHWAGIGGGGAQRGAGDGGVVTINGGDLYIYSYSGTYIHGAGIGGGGSSYGVVSRGTGNGGEKYFYGGTVDITVRANSAILYGTGIGGGGSYTTGGGGDGGDTVITGNAIVNIDLYAGSHMVGTGIGGGGSNGAGSAEKAGDSGNIEISGNSSVSVNISASSYHSGTGIGGGGGGGSRTPAGNGESIRIIEQSEVTITMNSTYMYGAGIGGGGTETAAKAGDSGNIEIGSKVRIFQTSRNVMSGSGIGAGGSNNDGNYAGNVNDITIDGADVIISRKTAGTSTATTMMYGAGIGAGGRGHTTGDYVGSATSAGGKITINSGTVNITMFSNYTSITDTNIHAPAIGGATCDIVINGGTITTSRAENGGKILTTSDDIGIGGTNASTSDRSLEVNGGTISVSSNGNVLPTKPVSPGTSKYAFSYVRTGADVNTGEAEYGPMDVFRVSVPIENPNLVDGRIYSVLADSELQFRYRDLNITSHHRTVTMNSTNTAIQSTSYTGDLYIYAPNATSIDISVEVGADGRVQYFTATTALTGVTPNNMTVAQIFQVGGTTVVYYRVNYNLRKDENVFTLINNSDIVHVESGTQFNEVLGVYSGDYMIPPAVRITTYASAADPEALLTGGQYTYKNGTASDPDVKGEIQTLISGGVTGRLTVYATASEKGEIIYENPFGGGVYETTTQVIYTGYETNLLPDTTFTRTGYEIIKWELDSTADIKYDPGASYTPSATSTKFTAVWQIKTMNVEVSGSNFTVDSPSGGSPYTVQHGTDFAIQVTPDVGYYINIGSFSSTPSVVPVEGTNGWYTFRNVTEDMDIEITPHRYQYTVEIPESLNPFYTIDKSGVTEKPFYGESVTFELTLLSSYTLNLFTVYAVYDEDSTTAILTPTVVTGGATYTLSNITKNARISIDVPDSFVVSFPTGLGFELDMKGDVRVNTGDDLVFELILSPGYRQDTVKVEIIRGDNPKVELPSGSWVDNKTNYTIMDVDSRVQVIVTVEKMEYNVTVLGDPKFKLVDKEYGESAVMQVPHGDTAYVRIVEVLEGYDVSRFTIAITAQTGEETIGIAGNGHWNIYNVTGDVTLEITPKLKQYIVSFNQIGCATAGVGGTEYVEHGKDLGNSTSSWLFVLPGYDASAYDPSDQDAVFKLTGSFTSITYDTSTKIFIIHGITSDVIGTIEFPKDHYDIRFDSNGGTGSVPALSTKEFLQTFTGNFNVRPIRAGFEFWGWSTDIRASSPMYEYTGVNTATFTFTVMNDVTLYAVWKPKTITIDYDLPNVTTPDDFVHKYDIIYGVGKQFTISSLPDVNREGYYIAPNGWNTESDGTGIWYIPGQQNMLPSSDLTLYLVWVENEVVLSFYGNGADSGTVAPLIGNYNENIVFPENGFTKDGHTFLGWALDPEEADDLKIFADGASAEKFPVSGTAYYAIWSANTAYLKYHPNHGSGSAVTGYTGETGDETSLLYPDDPSLDMGRPGYSFIGWNTKSDGSGTWYMAGSQIVLRTTSENDTITLYARWSQNTVKVIYDAGDGSGQQVLESWLYDDTAAEKKKFIVPTPSRTGYESPSISASNGEAYSFGISYDMIPKDLFLTVQWTRSVAGVIYDPNDGNSSHTAESGHTGDWHIILAHDSNELQYSNPPNFFLGWNTEADGSGTWYKAGDSLYMIGTITLYAKWVSGSIVISFNGNGAVGGTVEPLFLNAAGDITFPASDFSRPGYEFEGWALNPGETNESEIFKSGETSGTISSSATYYAIWSEHDAKLVYNSNYGTPTEVVIPVPNGTGTNMSVIDPEQLNPQIKRPGYEFKGWYLNEDGTGIRYVDGNYIFFTTSDASSTETTITLYAQWTAKTVTVTLGLNDGTSTILMAAIYSDTESKTFSIPTAEELEAGRPGFKATGLTSSLGGTYSFGQTDVILPSSDLILTVQWTADAASIEYNGNGATAGVPSKIEEETGFSVIIDDGSGLVYAGHTFKGWNTKSDGTGTWYNPGDQYQLIGELVVYAQWYSVQVTLYFDSQGGSDVASYTVTSGTLTYLPTELEVTKPGYTLAGWYITDPDSLITQHAPTTTTQYIAKWTAVPQDITFVLDGGSAPSDDPFDDIECATGGTYTILDAVPTKTGYRFDGWEYDGKVYLAGSGVTVPAGGIAFTAKWTQLVSIGFDANGGAGVPNNTSAPLGEAYTIPLTPAPTWADHAFIGYTTNAVGTGTLYKPGSTFLVETSTSVTFYAQWEQNVTLSYDLFQVSNGSNFPNQSVAPGTPVTVSDAMPFYSGSGYEFAGIWKGSDGNTYGPGVSITMNGNVTLYPQWKGVDVIVEYIVNGGTWAGSPTTSFTVPYGSEHTIITDVPTKSGQTFAGWLISGSDTAYFKGTKIIVDSTSKIVLTAQWVDGDATVTYNPNGGAGDVQYSTGNKGDVKGTPSSGFERNGYSLVGWSSDPDASPGDAGIILKGGDITLSAAYEEYFAVWLGDPVDVIYMIGKGEWDSGDEPSETTKVGDDYVVVSQVPKRSGYIFAGWYFNGTLYSGTDQIKNVLVADSLTLVAKWTATAITVTYDVNGGEWDGNSPSGAYLTGTADSEYQVFDGIPVRAGQSFMGWTIGTSGIVYQPGCKAILGDCDAVLTAVWRSSTGALDILQIVIEEGNGKVLYSTDGSEPSRTYEGSIDASPGDTVRLKAVPTKGDIFDRWTVNGSEYSSDGEISFVMEDGITIVKAYFGERDRGINIDLLKNPFFWLLLITLIAIIASAIYVWRRGREN